MGWRWWQGGGQAGGGRQRGGCQAGGGLAEHLGEVRVGVTASGVDAAMLVIKVESAGDGRGQGEAGGGGPVPGELVPLLLGDVLSHQEWGGDRGGLGCQLCGHKCNMCGKV